MNPNRRQFPAGAVAAALAAGSCGRGLTRNELADPAAGPPAVEGLDPDEAALLYYASLAPSGHNAQPWRVRVIKQFHWSVESDLGRALPATDPANREMTLGLGAFLENLSAAAGSLGYEAEIGEAQGTPGNGVSVDVRVVEASPSGVPLETISLRRVVKTGQLGRPFSRDTVTGLADKLEGYYYYFPRETAQGGFIAEVALEAFRRQMNDAATRSELSEWIRFDDDEARAQRDGLTPESMEVGGFAGWYFRHFIGREDVAGGDSFAQRGIDLAAGQISQGAGWIILAGAGDTAQTLIEAGRRFERLFLGARQRGVAVHPMSQALEISTWRDMLAVELGLDGTPQFVLRTGYIDRYPAPVSLRRPVDWFVERAG